MDILKHYNSLTRELEALKDRVRNFDQTLSWQTEGEWKESVLRSTLRRYLPSNIEVLRGFVVTPTASSRQIDVLLYDTSKPVLFRDGDLVFVTPDAVRGLIEVKTRIDSRSDLKKAIKPLSSNAELIRLSPGQSHKLFVGLFAYDSDLPDGKWKEVLEEVRNVAKGSAARIINNICLGCSLFSVFWDTDPERSGPESPYKAWHSYHLHELAAGFFINNLVQAVASDSVEAYKALWFPEEKESQRLGYLPFEPHNPSPTADR